MERIKFVLSSLVSLGWTGAKAQDEAPGLEDLDIASLLSEKEPNNPAHIVKSALNSKATG